MNPDFAQCAGMISQTIEAFTFERGIEISRKCSLIERANVLKKSIEGDNETFHSFISGVILVSC